MRIAAAALALALIGAPVFTEVTHSADPAPPETFTQRSLKAGRIQASLARLAAQRAENAEVRRFAAALARDLDARNSHLAGVARAEGLRDAMEDVPDYSSHEIPQRTREFHRLRVRGGPAFDKQFLRAVIIGHENAIRGYAAETRGGDPDVRKLAADALPRLKDQLGEARRLLEDIEERER